MLDIVEKKRQNMFKKLFLDKWESDLVERNLLNRRMNENYGENNYLELDSQRKELKDLINQYLTEMKSIRDEMVKITSIENEKCFEECEIIKRIVEELERSISLANRIILSKEDSISYLRKVFDSFYQEESSLSNTIRNRYTTLIDLIMKQYQYKKVLIQQSISSNSIIEELNEEGIHEDGFNHDYYDLERIENDNLERRFNIAMRSYRIIAYNHIDTKMINQSFEAPYFEVLRNDKLISLPVQSSRNISFSFNDVKENNIDLKLKHIIKLRNLIDERNRVIIEIDNQQIENLELSMKLENLEEKKVRIIKDMRNDKEVMTFSFHQSIQIYEEQIEATMEKIKKIREKRRDD